MNRRAASLALLASALLAGCGFHLAGTRPLPEPLKSVYIQVVQPYRVSEPPVEAALRAILQRRGAKVASSVAAARCTIRLSELTEKRIVISVGLDGKALEFEVVTSVRYEVLSDGQALIPPDALEVRRDYSFNAQEVLAKEAEEQRLRQFAQTELAELLMLRMEAQLSRAPPGPT